MPIYTNLCVTSAAKGPLSNSCTNVRVQCLVVTCCRWMYVIESHMQELVTVPPPPLGGRPSCTTGGDFKGGGQGTFEMGARGASSSLELFSCAFWPSPRNNVAV